MERKRTVSPENPDVKMKCSVKESRVTYSRVVMAKGKVTRTVIIFRAEYM